MVQETIFDNEKVLEIFNDPIRFKIFTELFFHPERTASEILDILPINRSTLSHHLTKLVDEKVLKVRINPTGRPIKHYSLAIPVHKVEVRSTMNYNSDLEKKKILQLIVQQMGFELRMANALFETYLQTIIEQENISGITISDSNIHYSLEENPQDLLNGGIFLTNKEHGAKFLKEIGEVIGKFRKEVFELNNQEKPKDNDFAVVLAGFNLKEPIKVQSKRIIIKEKSQD